MERYLAPDFLIPLFWGGIIGAFFSIAITVWWVRFSFLLLLTIVVAFAETSIFVRQNPLLFFRVPSRAILLPALSAMIFGLAVAIIYLIVFTPQPNIVLISVNFGFVPNHILENNRPAQRYLIGAAGVFMNDGLVNADNVRQAVYVYRRPETCASRPLTEDEIRSLEDEVHQDFISRLPESHPPANLEIPMYSIADTIPVRTAFQAPANVGENITKQQLEDFSAGKCVFFFLSRVRYGELRHVDYMRFAFKNLQNTFRVERYETRF